MTRNTGYALLAGLAAVVVIISTAIFVGFGGERNALSADGPRGRGQAAPASTGQWVGTWSAAPASAEPHTRHGLPDVSLRNVVHTSVGGSRARIHLSNLFGSQPLVVSHASLAVASAPSSPAAAAGTMRPLTFGGRSTVTVPVGGRVTSDAVRLDVPPDADLLVTTYSPEPSGPVTFHPWARQTNYLAAGDHCEDVQGTAYDRQSPFWRYLTGVDVWSTDTEGAVAVIGDSLTDGITSSPGANRRWTDFLAERLRTERDAPHYSVLNAGVSGNRLLVDGSRFSPNNGPSGLHRMHRVVARAGVKAVIVELGINDILKTPHQTDPEAILAGLRQLTRLAHQQGLRVLGGTLTPVVGHGRWTPQLETVRRQVNEEIRSGDVFDGVIDFDAALSDPAHPGRLRTAYDSGDHLHPSDNGYRAMAEAVDLEQLKGAVPAKL
jgi:lysophospholipase L1-like esterase